MLNINAIIKSKYELFEQELMNITQYISITNDNLHVYGNHIHELHIRVCSEMENVIKVIATNENYFKVCTSGDSFFKCLNSLCEHISLNKKIINCNLGIDTDSEIIKIQPFNYNFLTGKDSPYWREIYNDIKHDRYDNFHKFTLKNLIYALGALYICLIILFYYSKRNLLKVDKIPFNDPTQHGVFKSMFFSPTCSGKAMVYLISIGRNDLFYEKIEVSEAEYLQIEHLLIEGIKESIIEDSNLFLSCIWYNKAIQYDTGIPFYRKSKYCKMIVGDYSLL